MKEEFQEFQEGSRELEAELETQLEQVGFVRISENKAPRIFSTHYIQPY